MPSGALTKLTVGYGMLSEEFDLQTTNNGNCRTFKDSFGWLCAPKLLVVGQDR